MSRHQTLLPCDYCERLTEWLDLETQRFFCNTICMDKQCNGEEVIHSTRSIRKMPRSMVCSVEGNQRCHMLGLNAVKLIFNHYGFQCERIDDKTLKQLVIAVNARDVMYCCSPQQNLKDKYTEELFLDVFLYKRAPYSALNQEAIAMYMVMQRIFLKVQEKLGVEQSPVIDRILSDFAQVANVK